MQTAIEHSSQKGNREGSQISKSKSKKPLSSLELERPKQGQCYQNPGLAPSEGSQNNKGSQELANKGCNYCQERLPKLVRERGRWVLDAPFLLAFLSVNASHWRQVSKQTGHSLQRGRKQIKQGDVETSVMNSI